MKLRRPKLLATGESISAPARIRDVDWLGVIDEIAAFVLGVSAGVVGALAVLYFLR